MNTKTHYQTDLNGLFIGPVDCLPNPHEEGKWWVPFGAFEDAPPEKGPHQVQRRIEGGWELIPDYRGYVYWTAERQRVVIDQVEVEPPAGHLTEDPGPTPAQRLADLKGQARAALAEGDQVATRCVKFGVGYPQAWRDRDAALVSILNLPAGTDPEAITVPARPPYPEGTGWSD